VNPTPDELSALIAGREGKRLEFKRGLPGPAKVARTLAAFANTRGGLLLVGVGDRGELVGAPRPRETMEHLRAVAAERLEPPLEVQVSVVTLQEKRIVCCSVPLSHRRPHAALDDEGARAIVMRVGSSNRVASGAALAALRAQRSGGAGLDALQRAILVWVERVARTRPGEDATVAGFARAHNVGLQRARRAFTQLELAGRLVAHGAGARRAYAVP